MGQAIILYVGWLLSEEMPGAVASAVQHQINRQVAFSSFSLS